MLDRPPRPVIAVEAKLGHPRKVDVIPVALDEPELQFSLGIRGT